MHTNITLEIKPSQIENLIDRMPVEDKIRLVRKLLRQTWGKRIDNTVHRMRACARKKRLSSIDIDHLCEDVKKEYDEKHRSH